jgi:UDP-N-acetylglucosamine transferase subunit ALG13
MIFVTVGTHEQGFNRLIQAIDGLKNSNFPETDIFIQTGYSTYKPRYCQYKDFIRFDEILKRIEDAEMIITHGGTGSIMLVLYRQKIPVVVPRQKKYDEHIDNHQLIFCKMLESKRKIIAAYEMEELGPVISNYPRLAHDILSQEQSQTGNMSVSGLNEKAGIFAKRLNELCIELTSPK